VKKQTKHVLVRLLETRLYYFKLYFCLLGYRIVSSVGCRKQEAPVRIATVMNACPIFFNLPANVVLKIAVFCVVTPCVLLARRTSGRNLLIDIYHENGGSRFFRNVDNYQTVRGHIPEDTNLHNVNPKCRVVCVEPFLYVVSFAAGVICWCCNTSWTRTWAHVNGLRMQHLAFCKEQPPTVLGVCVSSLYLCPKNRNLHDCCRYELRLCRLAHRLLVTACTTCSP